MTYLVISDTHGDTQRIRTLLPLFAKQVAGVIFLGDNSRDMVPFAKLYPALDFHIVTGNNEMPVDALQERVITVGGKRVFITHGHRYNVKSDMLRLTLRAQELEVAACLFGHTHQAAAFYEQGMYFFNPGSLGHPHWGEKPSYGLLHVGEEGVGGTIKTM